MKKTSQVMAYNQMNMVLNCIYS